MKLIVCENCEAEFRIKHDLDENYYSVRFCVFCGSELTEELELSISSLFPDSKFWVNT